MDVFQSSLTSSFKILEPKLSLLFYKVGIIITVFSKYFFVVKKAIALSLCDNEESIFFLFYFFPRILVFTEYFSIFSLLLTNLPHTFETDSYNC